MIKQRTRCDEYPDGLGITLCVGEQTPDTYERFFQAGAHRYLLRIETSNPRLFARIHPDRQKFSSRLACLETLQEIGFQVGTGVMIGLPGQTVEDLVDDIEFFVSRDIDMIGMGPYIPHPDTPLGRLPCADAASRLRLSYLMIALARLAMPDVNIAATTALQTLDPAGRETGLLYGANVLMPQLTPVSVRRDYLLYPGKPCLEETAEMCLSCLEGRIKSVGRVVSHKNWGDPLHALKRQACMK
jgi:biotin synthase